MIFEIISYTGSAMLTGPVTYVMYRAFQFRNTISRGKEMHNFKPHIRRDMHGPHAMNWCDVCKRGKKAWIHYPERYKDDESLSIGASIAKLEREEIKWRFENDPEWVKVFGEEYDPKTFQEIPKFHNGECGGPHDSCERCAWEADQAKAAEKKRRRDLEAEQYAERRTATEKDYHLFREEVRGYVEILRDIWDDLGDFKDAHEEWEDIRDEIGMLKNDQLRKEIKGKTDFKRLAYFFDEGRKLNWNRREEVWQDKLKRDRSSRYDYY